MDVTIARVHISVHRAAAQPAHPQPVAGRVERAVNQAQMLARVEQERDQVRNSARLFGIH